MFLASFAVARVNPTPNAVVFRMYKANEITKRLEHVLLETDVGLPRSGDVPVDMSSCKIFAMNQLY